MADVTREELLAGAGNDTPKIQAVEAPGLGTVYIREMTSGDYDEYQVALYKTKMQAPTATMLACCLCDEEGKRLYAKSDAPALSRLSQKVIEPLATVARLLNGFEDEEDEPGKE